MPMSHSQKLGRVGPMAKKVEVCANWGIASDSIIEPSNVNTKYSDGTRQSSPN